MPSSRAICVNTTADRCSPARQSPPTTALTHSTPFRSPRSSAKVSTNSGEVRESLLPVLAHGAVPPQTPLLEDTSPIHAKSCDFPTQ
jgi:hypothetical protein